MDPCFVSLPTKGAWKRLKPPTSDTKPAIKIVLYSKMLEQHKTMQELFPKLTSWCITAGCDLFFLMLPVDIYDEAQQHCTHTVYVLNMPKQWWELIKYRRQTVTSEKKWLDRTDQLCLFNPMPCFVTIMATKHVGNKVGVVQCPEKISVAPKPWKEQLN